MRELAPLLAGISFGILLGVFIFDGGKKDIKLPNTHEKKSKEVMYRDTIERLRGRLKRLYTTQEFIDKSTYFCECGRVRRAETFCMERHIKK